MCTRNPAPRNWKRCARSHRRRASRWPRGRFCKTRHLNSLLAQAEGSEFDELINISTTLRSMTQAYYFPENFGHFGLSLRSYAHFTSPIRRYSDLIVHRALVSGHGWGDDGLSAGGYRRVGSTPPSISRKPSAARWLAERDTTDRYLAAYPCQNASATSSPAACLWHRAVRAIRETGRQRRGRAGTAQFARQRVFQLQQGRSDPCGVNAQNFTLGLGQRVVGAPDRGDPHHRRAGAGACWTLEGRKLPPAALPAKGGNLGARKPMTSAKHKSAKVKKKVKRSRR